MLLSFLCSFSFLWRFQVSEQIMPHVCFLPSSSCRQSFLRLSIKSSTWGSGFSMSLLPPCKIYVKIHSFQFTGPEELVIVQMVLWDVCCIVWRRWTLCDHRAAQENERMRIQLNNPQKWWVLHCFKGLFNGWFKNSFSWSSLQCLMCVAARHCYKSPGCFSSLWVLDESPRHPWDVHKISQLASQAAFGFCSDWQVTC